MQLDAVTTNFVKTRRPLNGASWRHVSSACNSEAERGRDRERQGVTSMYNKWQQHSPPGPLTLCQQSGYRARADRTSNVQQFIV
eukprot:1143297-Pelagomonas_calceolata.AAC.1